MVNIKYRLATIAELAEAKAKQAPKQADRVFNPPMVYDLSRRATKPELAEAKAIHAAKQAARAEAIENGIDSLILVAKLGLVVGVIGLTVLNVWIIVQNMT